jgi:release factor glutamine methyltransferase
VTHDPRDAVAATLADAGFLAPQGDAAEILEAVDAGRGSLEELVHRRVAGEPLAWIVGRITFAGADVRVDRGVFVPRAQTEALARRAIELLPEEGVAVDLCTGCGAIAVALRHARPGATIVATDLDERAVANAHSNGVEVRLGDLDAPLPDDLRGHVDVLTAVTPYVPSEEIHLLPRDVLEHEPRPALDGGPGGTALALRVIELSPRWLRPGGVVLLEIGGDQAAPLADAMRSNGLTDVVVHADDDGRDRAMQARMP